ncbi:hypothetical protein [Noviherbaspirillum massiliense]|uniref:hypothetical protein n=1 Tax=Noviherbaspirillum massiliense TaxID=1465823 RepID=UPI0002D67DED|nr:hypothetical protein [Noviherbaspirillum massiliense]
MRFLLRVAAAIHFLISAFFVCACLVLIYIAVATGAAALESGPTVQAAQGVIEAIGLLSVAVVALQIAQTIGEEEVVREAHVSAPTRVRRFLSRFMVVVVVAIAIEGLVATFKALHENPAQLPHAATILFSVGVVLAGWGAFIWFNRSAEELEPEAMQQAKNEDKKLR